MIKAIILDGFHKGHTFSMEYMPIVKLLKPRTLIVDYCCDNDTHVDNPIPEEIVYQECFRGVDKDVVLYSEKGKSLDILSMFAWEDSLLPCTPNTTLYFGYHNEPIRRKDDGTQMTEYERGIEKGIEEGRILQAKEFDKKFK